VVTFAVSAPFANPAGLRTGGALFERIESVEREARAEEAVEGADWLYEGEAGERLPVEARALSYAESFWRLSGSRRGSGYC
jgi:hypothetical protein